MQECKVEGQAIESVYDQLVNEMQSDSYWIRFFVRPCCPAPNLEGACSMLDHLKSDVDARDDFTDEQKATLHEIIESRKEWYPTSGLCRTSRKQ